MLNHYLIKVLLATLFIQQVLATYWIVNVDKTPSLNDATYLTFNLFDTSERGNDLKAKCSFSRKFDTSITNDKEDNYLTCGGKTNPSIDVIGHDTTLTGLKVLNSDKVYPCVPVTNDKNFDTYTCSELTPAKK